MGSLIECIVRAPMPLLAFGVLQHAGENYLDSWGLTDER